MALSKLLEDRVLAVEVLSRSAGIYAVTRVCLTLSSGISTAVKPVFCILKQLFPAEIWVAGGIVDRPVSNPIARLTIGNSCHWDVQLNFPPTVDVFASSYAWFQGSLFLFGPDCYRVRFEEGAAAWERIQKMWSRRSFAAATLEGKIYVIGGYDAMETLECFDPRCGIWEPLACLPGGRRFNAQVAALPGCGILICGGVACADWNSDAETETPSDGEGNDVARVECWHPHLQKWQVMPDMAIGRSGAMLAVMGGRLYVCGGCAGSDYFRDAERLGWSNLTNQWAWESLPAMQEPRADAACAVVANELIVVCGGESGAMPALNSVEALHASRETLPLRWQVLAPMSRGRAGAAAVAMQGSIYVFGGFSDGDFLATAEKLNVQSRTDLGWEELEHLPHGVAGGVAFASVP